MKPLLVATAILAALVVPAVVLAHNETGFDAVIGSIETRYHVHATQVPFMGLIGLIGRKATNGGVGRMHVAEIDNFTAPVDGEELNSLVEHGLGPGWERMIRETSRKGGGQTLIFVRPEGERMGMFIVDLDGKEMDVVEISVSPDRLSENLSRYEHHAREENPDHEGTD
ncbi:MAG: hypothetical protein WCE75_13630 [Terracidiphilus sp.]